MSCSRMFRSTVYKPTEHSTPLGLQLWATPYDDQTVIVVHIDDHGLFAGKLKAGMQIDRINDMHCAGLSVAQIEDYLGRLSGRITILASAPKNILKARTETTTAATAPPSLVEISDDETSETEAEDELETLLQCPPSDPVYQRLMIASYLDAVVDLFV